MTDSKQSNLYYIGTLCLNDFKARLYFLKDDQRCFRTLLAADSAHWTNASSAGELMSKDNQFKLRDLADIVSKVYGGAALASAQSSVLPSPYPRETAVWLWGLSANVGTKSNTFANVPYVGFTPRDKKYRFTDGAVPWYDLYVMNNAANSMWNALRGECEGLEFVKLSVE